MLSRGLYSYHKCFMHRLQNEAAVVFFTKTIQTILDDVRSFEEEPHLVVYAVTANSNKPTCSNIRYRINLNTIDVCLLQAIQLPLLHS